MSVLSRHTIPPNRFLVLMQDLLKQPHFHSPSSAKDFGAELNVCFGMCDHNQVCIYNIGHHRSFGVAGNRNSHVRKDIV